MILITKGLTYYGTKTDHECPEAASNTHTHIYLILHLLNNLPSVKCESNSPSAKIKNLYLCVKGMYEFCVLNLT